MVYLDSSVLLLALWVFCIIDVIVTDEYRMRNLPKAAWLIVVLLLPVIGSVVWLVAGHPWESRSQPPTTRLGQQFPEYDRPGRQTATNPDDDEAFLRQLRQRAEQQRQRAAEQRRAAEDREPGQTD